MVWAGVVPQDDAALGGCCVCVFSSHVLATAPLVKARRVLHSCSVSRGLHLFSVFFCPTRTNRGHTGGGKHRAFFFFLYSFVPHLPPAVRAYIFIASRVQPSLSVFYEEIFDHRHSVRYRDPISGRGCRLPPHVTPKVGISYYPPDRACGSASAFRAPRQIGVGVGCLPCLPICACLACSSRRGVRSSGSISRVDDDPCVFVVFIRCVWRRMRTSAPQEVAA